MATLTQARRAAKIAAKIHGKATIKSTGKGEYSICIGWTDRDDDRAYNAISAKLGNALMGFGHIEVCADISGHGVTTVEAIYK